MDRLRLTVLSAVAATFAASVGLQRSIGEGAVGGGATRPHAFFAGGWTTTFLLPATVLLMYVLLERALLLVPKERRTSRSADLFRKVAAMGVVTAAFIAIAGVWATSHSGRSIDSLIMVMAGLLIIVIGNYFPKTTRNPIMGIRTPWTLANEDVWFRTQRVAAFLFLAAGAVIIAGGIAGWKPIWALPFVLTAGTLSALYSYVIYRRLATT